MKENMFQASLIRTIKNLLPGCIILKLDPNYIQGIPDLLILYGITWATLECKKSEAASHRPNQDYYVNVMNKMSFSAFVYPENVQQVLEDMVNHFNRINSMILTSTQIDDLMSDKTRIYSLLNTYNYNEVGQA